MKLQPTTGSPGLRALLKLQKHVTTVVIIVEVMDIINDQNRRATLFFTVTQCHFFELVES